MNQSFQEVFEETASSLKYFRYFPKRLYKAALEDQEAAAQYCLSYLGEMMKEDILTLPDEEANKGFAALAILTGLKEKKAFPLVLSMMTEDYGNHFLGDYFTEDFHDIIRRTYDGNLDGVLKTIYAEDTDVFAIGAVCRAFSCMTARGEMEKAEFEKLIHAIVDWEDADPMAIALAMDSVLDSGDLELGLWLAKEIPESRFVTYVFGGTRDYLNYLESGKARTPRLSKETLLDALLFLFRKVE